jgi:uncharacterized membrane protein HdeD (DUF308 family)
MRKQESILFKVAGILLAIVGISILLFGLIVTLNPGSTNALFYRAIGVASIGMGLFGMLITLIPYRHREHWAWFALWYYPIFWAAHFFGNLPPGQDHIHQIVFILFSLIGLLISVREFFSRPSSEN